MNFVFPYTAQGDLNFFAVDEIPSDVTETVAEQHVLAHSETGHHHVVDRATVRVYNRDEFESFLEVPQEAEVIHLRGFDTHDKINLPAGKYRVTRQREYTPEGYRRAAD